MSIPEIVTEHHKPRKIDKKKRHAYGYNEDAPTQRQSRIGFKLYLQELEEELLDDNLEDNNEE